MLPAGDSAVSFVGILYLLDGEGSEEHSPHFR